MYRTKTYIAADWIEDEEAVNQIYKWNDSNYWNLSFANAHDFTQARDSSLNCTIKKSLYERLNISKKFILIVGDKTKTLRSGGCEYCKSYNSFIKYCVRGYGVDYRSYIEYECDKAINDNLTIFVLYNATHVDKNKCPISLINKGTHIPMKYYQSGEYFWDYNSVKKAFI